MWRLRMTVTMLAMAAVVAACGGSTTASRQTPPAPTATPDPDVGRSQADRDAALRESVPPPSP
jgi:hypothetical protein